MKNTFDRNTWHELLELGSKVVGEIIELEVQTPSLGIFPSYLIKEISKEQWLIEGRGPAVSWSQKKLEEVGDIDFALSLARTVEESTVIWDWKKIEKIVPDMAIIQWARLYGLPKVERIPLVFEDLPQVETPIEAIVPPEASEDRHGEPNIFGCRVQEFRIHAVNFFLMFKIWHELGHPTIEDSPIMEDREIREWLERLLSLRYVPLQPSLVDSPDDTGWSQMTERFRKGDIQRYLQVGGNDLRARAKATLGSFVDDNIGTTISLEYHPQKRKFGLIAENLYTVGFFHFATLLSQPKESLKKYLKKCDYCQKDFWGRGRAKYCTSCDRRTVWSRRHR